MISRLKALIRALAHLQESIDEIKINQGLILTKLQQLPALTNDTNDNSNHEFKIFSQWGEDGILQFITSSIFIENKTFIEFGVHDFMESNCRFLLIKDGWSGFVIDGSKKNIQRLRENQMYWKYPLQAISAFITKENIAELLDSSGFNKNCGILSIDIDGVDWHILNQLTEWNASIVVVEYNSIFGANLSVTVPYTPDFNRSRAHYSDLYWGASLSAFSNLLINRGYSLVATNTNGNNAFFVKSALLTDKIKSKSPSDCFQEATFRESKGLDGQIVHVPHQSRRNAIAHLPLVNTITGQIETLDKLKA